MLRRGRTVALCAEPTHRRTKESPLSPRLFYPRYTAMLRSDLLADEWTDAAVAASIYDRVPYTVSAAAVATRLASLGVL